jgi:hypothetical protein
VKHGWENPEHPMKLWSFSSENSNFIRGFVSAKHVLSEGSWNWKDNMLLATNVIVNGDSTTFKWGFMDKVWGLNHLKCG